MTRVFNDPSTFVHDALRGMAAVGGRVIVPVRGGVVRSTRVKAGTPALIIGGGSGHYPAFAGWVGVGLAHGAACGGVFAAPAASLVESVARAADQGGGFLFIYGNYAGDNLHFGEAARRLRAQGHDVRIVPVSDDIASDSPDNHRNRRGTAGDLVVMKIVGAALEEGSSLDDAERIAWKANDSVKTLGIAFAGCTLPGATEPMFTLPEGLMTVGAGAHGEAGVNKVPMASADPIADMLLDEVLAEEPSRSSGGYRGRVSYLVNGLGAVKYEELFIVASRIDERIRDRGLIVIAPEVGELKGSLDMAALSLTLVYLDDELERLWCAPADTLAFHRSAPADAEDQHAGPDDVDAYTIKEVPPAAPDSRDAARFALAMLERVSATVDARQELWGRMDAITGDGDHGQGMAFGIRGALASARESVLAGAGVRATLERAGTAWAESAGGTSGALWGAALVAVGGALSDDAGPDAQAMVDAVLCGAQAIADIGGAEVGDRTMIDAVVPFAQTLRRAIARNEALGAAWGLAAHAAVAGAASTANIAARRGRSRVLGQNVLGTPDPGATSFAEIAVALTPLVRRVARGGADGGPE